MSESHVPIYGTADRKLETRGSRDNYLGPPAYATEGLGSHDQPWPA